MITDKPTIQYDDDCRDTANNLFKFLCWGIVWIARKPNEYKWSMQAFDHTIANSKWDEEGEN